MDHRKAAKKRKNKDSSDIQVFLDDAEDNENEDDSINNIKDKVSKFLEQIELNNNSLIREFAQKNEIREKEMEKLIKLNKKFEEELEQLTSQVKNDNKMLNDEILDCFKKIESFNFSSSTSLKISPEVFKFSIGGEKEFTIAKENLNKHTKSYLTFVTQNHDKDKNGAFFINKHFDFTDDRIFSYLSDGQQKHLYHDLNDDQLEEISETLNFYKLDKPLNVEKIHSKEEKSKPVQKKQKVSPSSSKPPSSNSAQKPKPNEKAQEKQHLSSETEPLVWDKESSSNPAFIDLEDNDRTVNFIIWNPSENRITTSTTATRFTVKVNEKDGDTRIGFLGKYDDELYYLSLNGNLARSNKKAPTWKVDRYEASASKGDYITVIKEGKNIRFMKNKKDLGIGFQDVSAGPMYPFITNDINKKCSFTLIDKY